MKTEISAGGIVVQKINNFWHVLLIKDMNSIWTFPKGIIESGEVPQNTAEREIHEETGLQQLKYIRPLSSISYMYQKNGLIKKTVHYFLFITKLSNTLTPQRSEGISEVKWFELDKASSLIGYRKTNVKLLDDVRQYLKNDNKIQNRYES